MGRDVARLFTNRIRVRLMFEYGAETTSPSKIASRIGVPLNLVSYHTHVLARHGCIELVRTGLRRGGMEHYYRSTLDAAVEDADWERVPLELRRALVHETLNVAQREAKDAAIHGGFDDPRAHLSRIPLELDDAARAAVAAVLRQAVEDIDAITAGCRARPSATRTPCEVVMLHFERPSVP